VSFFIGTNTISMMKFVDLKLKEDVAKRVTLRTGQALPRSRKANFQNSILTM